MSNGFELERVSGFAIWQVKRIGAEDSGKKWSGLAMFGAVGCADGSLRNRAVVLRGWRVRSFGSDGLLWRTEFDLVLVWWVYVDRRRRGFSVPFEFEAFVFFAWPIVVPYYLVRTRGLRGLVLVAGVYTLAILPLVVGIVARMERGR